MAVVVEQAGFGSAVVPDLSGTASMPEAAWPPADRVAQGNG